MLNVFSGEPPSAAITYLDGDTPPRLGFRLYSRNVRSGEVRIRPVAEDVVEWSIRFSDGAVEKTSATGGGLTIDEVSRFVFYPLTVDDASKIPLGGSVPFVVRVVNGDGIRRTYATGTITRKKVGP